VVRRIGEESQVEYREVWPLAGGTIEATSTRVERSGANVEARMQADDPTSCRWRTWHGVRYARGDWDCTLEAEAELTADATTFHIREKLVAKRGEAVVFEREHRNAIARDLM
jgi:hypothetical protein